MLGHYVSDASLDESVEKNISKAPAMKKMRLKLSLFPSSVSDFEVTRVVLDF